MAGSLKTMDANKSRHTFSICAYKESPYLEACICSLKKQTVKTNIILCTSTPCEFISNTAEKYQLPVYVRDGKSDIKDDWNFAYNTAETELVTIAHQDDIYHRDYVKYLLQKFNHYPDMSIFITDYRPIKGGTIGKRDLNSHIRYILRVPIKITSLADRRWLKRMILSLGNTIVCPLVTYHKKKLGPSIFTSPLKFNIDWDTFLKLADGPGRFVYVDKPLGFYRIHDAATSKEFIDNQKRIEEDTIMFDKFWPGFLVKLIMKFYTKAYQTYQ